MVYDADMQAKPEFLLKVSILMPVSVTLRRYWGIYKRIRFWTIAFVWGDTNVSHLVHASTDP